MKYSIICLFFLIFSSCKQQDAVQNLEESKTQIEELTSASSQNFFGQEFDVTTPKTADEAGISYNTLKQGDTIDVTFQSTVNSVCKKKGCWMRLEMPEGTETFVKFKDYGFFVPKDIAGQKAIVHGKAFITETSVEDLKHFAEDAGKSKDEIDAITEPQIVYGFTADGVYIEQ